MGTLDIYQNHLKKKAETILPYISVIKCDIMDVARATCNLQLSPAEDTPYFRHPDTGKEVSLLTTAARRQKNTSAKCTVRVGPRRATSPRPGCAERWGHHITNQRKADEESGRAREPCLNNWESGWQEWDTRKASYAEVPCGLVHAARLSAMCTA
jgi:hypothetical protein